MHDYGIKLMQVQKLVPEQYSLVKTNWRLSATLIKCPKSNIGGSSNTK